MNNPISSLKNAWRQLINRRASLRSRILVVCVLLSGCDAGQRVGTSNLDDFARFGRSVDMSGFDAVVGAYQESDGAAEGAVYIYSRRDDIWSIQARLESPSPGDEQFGDDVAIFGNIVAVGAPLDHKLGALRSGSVYLFERASDGSWSHFQTLSSPTPRQAWEAFGISVALYQNTLVVGALDRDQGTETDAGAAFVYERTGSTFVLSDTLAATSPLAFDKFGSDVDIFEDTVAVSAVRRDESGFTDSGAVFVFEDGGAGFAYSQTLIASDIEDDQLFGTGVSLFEFGDGSRRLAVGAEGSTVASASNAGAVYVFDAPIAGVFAQTVKLTASDAAANDIFGTDVGLWAGTIVVGASGVDDGEAGAGAAYIFELDGAVWSEEAKLVAGDANQNAFMGGAVDIWGTDYVLLGATGEETGPGFTDTGLVRAFRRATASTWTESHSLSPMVADSTGSFRLIGADGSRLITASFYAADIFEYGNDAYSLQQTVAEQVGNIESVALDGDTAAVFSRAQIVPLEAYAEVLTFVDGEWVQEQLIEPDLVSTSFPQESANATTLSLEGDTLVIGSNRWNGGDGRVFIYERDAGVWSVQHTFTSPQASGNFDMNFGDNIDLSGDWLAVSEVPSGGVPGSPRNGNVFLYERQPNGDFVEQQVLSEAVPAAYDRFGELISLDDDLLAVYSQVADVLYVYKRSGATYSEVWQLAGVGGIGGLFINQSELAIAYPGATVDGTLNVGEVVVYERQPDDSYLAGEVYHPYDMRADTNMGYDTILTDDHVIVRATNHTYILPRQ